MLSCLLGDLAPEDAACAPERVLVDGPHVHVVEPARHQHVAAQKGQRVHRHLRPHHITIIHTSATNGTAASVQHGQSPAELQGCLLCLAWSLLGRAWRRTCVVGEVKSSCLEAQSQSARQCCASMPTLHRRLPLTGEKARCCTPSRWKPLCHNTHAFRHHIHTRTLTTHLVRAYCFVTPEASGSHPAQRC